MAGGWPCTDASPSNIDASSERNRLCVAEGTLRTGSVFAGIVNWSAKSAEQGHLDFTLGENAPASASPLRQDGEVSGPGNLSAACAIFSQRADMVTFAFSLNPQLFGCPQSRDRLWFPSFPRRRLVER
eukprot:6231339-Pyramimonas_sp.AAC.1